jgi:hypothetical protein
LLDATQQLCKRTLVFKWLDLGIFSADCPAGFDEGLDAVWRTLPHHTDSSSRGDRAGFEVEARLALRPANAVEELLEPKEPIEFVWMLSNVKRAASPIFRTDILQRQGS